MEIAQRKRRPSDERSERDAEKICMKSPPNKAERLKALSRVAMINM